jgi:hypothetical protein
MGGADDEPVMHRNSPTPSGDNPDAGVASVGMPASGAPVGRDANIDPSWRGLITTGAIAAVAYVVLGIVAPALLFLPVGYPRTAEGETLLTFIADHREWWMVLQTLTLGPSFLAIPVFAALFVALASVEKGYAAVGSLLAISCQVLFVSFYPGTLGMLYLSDQYTAAGAERRQQLAAAAEAVTAPLDSYNPLYETVFAAGVLILSLLMLRGAFPNWIAYLGIAAAGSELIGVSLLSLIGMGYFWWWLIFGAWFVGVGWRLWRMRPARRSTPPPQPGR